MNVEERDIILYGDYRPDRYGPHGNYAPRFSGLSLDQVTRLVEMGAMRPEMNQNGSPTTREFMEYLAEFPAARVSGFATHRPSDTVAVITTVTLRTDDSIAIAAFATKFHDADEFTLCWNTSNNQFECYAWWD